MTTADTLVIEEVYIFLEKNVSVLSLRGIEAAVIKERIRVGQPALGSLEVNDRTGVSNFCLPRLTLRVI